MYVCMCVYLILHDLLILYHEIIMNSYTEIGLGFFEKETEDDLHSLDEKNEKVPCMQVGNFAFE